MSAVQFDKNEGSTRTGEWLGGVNWEGSDLQKACKDLEIKLPNQVGSGGVAQKTDEQPKQDAQPKPEMKKEAPAQKEPVIVDSEVGEDFDEDTIPF